MVAEKVAFFHKYIETGGDFPPKLEIIGILLPQPARKVKNFSSYLAYYSTTNCCTFKLLTISKS